MYIVYMAGRLPRQKAKNDAHQQLCPHVQHSIPFVAPVNPDPDVVPLIDRDTTKFAVAQSNGSEKAGCHHRASQIVEVAACFPKFSFDCYSAFIHAYYSVCFRAQLVKVGPDVCQKSRMAKDCACIAHDNLIRKLCVH